MESHLDEEKPSLAEAKEDHVKKRVDFDDLLSLVGGFGRYTGCLYAFMCLVSIPTGAQNLVQVFYGATPEFHCSQPRVYVQNATCAVNTCCKNCSNYDFKTTFTSAVTEVSLMKFGGTRNLYGLLLTSYVVLQCNYGCIYIGL